jgi:hypothetical protein
VDQTFLSVRHKKDVVIAATVLFERLPIRQDDVPQQLMTLQRNLSRKTDSTLLRDSNLTAIDLLFANDFRDAMSTLWRKVSAFDDYLPLSNADEERRIRRSRPTSPHVIKHDTNEHQHDQLRHLCHHSRSGQS